MWKLCLTSAIALLCAAPLGAQSAVVINEFLADNDTTDKDEAGEFDDWVELFNKSNQTVDLTGHYLSDDLTNAKKWKFPDGTKIPAGGFLRIWCDNQPTQGKLHATFKLDDGGEAIGLFAPDAQQNKLLDGLKYAKQKGDRSFGRVPDGGTQWAYVWVPTGAKSIFATSPYARYDSRRNGAESNLRLRGSGQAKVNFLASLDLDRGKPNTVAVLFLSALPGSLDLGNLGFLNVHLPTLVIVSGVALNANGAGSLSFTVPSVAGGLTVYFQAFGLGADLTNALATRFLK